MRKFVTYDIHVLKPKGMGSAVKLCLSNRSKKNRINFLKRDRRRKTKHNEKVCHTQDGRLIHPSSRSQSEIDGQALSPKILETFLSKLGCLTW